MYILICIHGNDLKFKSTMHQMWISPIQVFSLLDLDDVTDNKEIKQNGDYVQESQLFKQNYFHNMSHFVKDLSRSVIKEFETFRSNRSLVIQYKQLFDLHEDALDSDVYFFYQQELKIYCSDMNKYDNTLQRIIYSAIFSYLRECNIGIDTLNSLSQSREKLTIWTSLHGNGSFHNSHHHASSAVSGVFYLQIPKYSGDLYFEDPRGKHKLRKSRNHSKFN